MILSLKLLGGSVEIELFDVPEDLRSDIEKELICEGLRLQKIFNFYDPQSELQTLNKKRSMAVSSDLFDVIEKAKLYATKTKGAYDISKGKEFLQRKSGRETTPVDCSYRDIFLDRKNKHISLQHADVLIDLGSIAKGYIVDKLISFIEQLGVENALVDARGDMRVLGNHTEKIEIQHPRKDEGILPFTLHNAAVATSGDYKQYYGSYKTSHIVGDTDLISVTVKAPTACESDVLASCIYLLGTANTAKFIEQFKNVSAVCVDAKQNVRSYGTWI